MQVWGKGMQVYARGTRHHHHHPPDLVQHPPDLACSTQRLHQMALSQFTLEVFAHPHVCANHCQILASRDGGNEDLIREHAPFFQCLMQPRHVLSMGTEVRLACSQRNYAIHDVVDEVVVDEDIVQRANEEWIAVRTLTLDLTVIRPSAALNAGNPGSKSFARCGSFDPVVYTSRKVLSQQVMHERMRNRAEGRKTAHVSAKSDFGAHGRLHPFFDPRLAGGIGCG
eukprot:2291272-Prymnesium_polylepis.1